MLRDNSSGSNDASCTDNGPVHNNGSHTDQDVILDRTAMNNSIVGNGYVVSDGGFIPLIRAMNNGAILNVGLVANDDRVYVAPDYGVEPNSTIAAHRYIADDGCIVGKPTVFAELWMITSNRFN